MQKIEKTLNITRLVSIATAEGLIVVGSVSLLFYSFKLSVRNLENTIVSIF
jgi:hypothetical protein